MEQSGPRHNTEENFLIVGNRSWLRACADFIFTLFFWLYSLLVIVFFASATLGLHNELTQTLNGVFNTINQDIRNLVILAGVIFLFFYVSLSINALYNKKRFGVLRRRVYPSPVTIDELVSLGLMDRKTIEELQTQEYAVFEKNPIASLVRKKI